MLDAQYMIVVMSNLSKKLISGTSRIETQASDSQSTILFLETSNAFQLLFYILTAALVSKEP